MIDRGAFPFVPDDITGLFRRLNGAPMYDILDTLDALLKEKDFYPNFNTYRAELDSAGIFVQRMEVAMSAVLAKNASQQTATTWEKFEEVQDFKLRLLPADQQRNIADYWIAGPKPGLFKMRPGSADESLLKRTDELITMFDLAINKLKKDDDLRLFFTYAHGYITKKIRKHIDLFAAPNPLMRLNDSFASTYLNAINGTPHTGWQDAFKHCATLDETQVSTTPSGAPGPYVPVNLLAMEECGMCMAEVHINRDLKDALRAVKGVNAQDYGNVLIFVTEGNLFAEVQTRGQAVGSLAFMGSSFVGGKMNMSAKIWRNQVFKEVYGQDVPDPSPAFVAAYHKGA
jgi:hypothetical protein